MGCFKSSTLNETLHVEMISSLRRCRLFLEGRRRIVPVLRILVVVLVGAWALASTPGMARGYAPRLFCETHPQSPSCAGTKLACSYCHDVIPPNLNIFGSAIKSEYVKRGIPFEDRADTFKDVLDAVGAKDSDGDQVVNRDEIIFGTLPGVRDVEGLRDPKIFDACKAERAPKNNFYKLCQYDYDYAYKKVWHTVCGEPPEWEDFVKFRDLPVNEKPAALKKQLESCLDYEYWIGKDGVVWEIGHYKIRPVGSVKAGEDSTIIPLVDYYDDYHIFVYSQIDGHDARHVLTADYAVKREVKNGSTVYTRLEPNRLDDGIVMQPEYRAGLLTSFWTLGFYLNYTAVARVLVAQAFNGFLGISLANMQGLESIRQDESSYADFDDKKVDNRYCAECHTTIDPMAYPFRNYNGLSGSTQVLAGKESTGLQDIKKLGDETNLTPLSYSLPRMGYFRSKYPRIDRMPERGFVLGQPVADLKEWARVVADSDQFAAQTVKDYWKVLIGHEPLPRERAEFERLWRNFKTLHGYSVEAMLAEMIMTEAFGVP